MSEIIRGSRFVCVPLVWFLSLLFLITTEQMPALQASASDASTGACLSQVRTAVSMVTMQLVDRVRLPGDARTEMMRETAEVWRAAGLEITWSTLPSAAAGSTQTQTQTGAAERSRPLMTVVVTPETPEALRAGSVHTPVLASILFIDGKPTTMIAAYPSEVQRLLDTVPMDARAVSERPALLRHRLMGRVLGRAVAHELGHYLFGSAEHTPTGLMRARHRLDDLTSPFGKAFRVVPALDPCAW